MIEFKTASHKAVYEKVAGLLKEQFGKQVWTSDTEPGFGLRFGSAFVRVTVAPINEQFASVRALSWVVTGAEASTDLYRYLLNENISVRFGAFGVDEAGDVFFTHAIVGEGCDADELMFSVMGVASTADDYDDKIVQRFGGQRAVDREG